MKDLESWEYGNPEHVAIRRQAKEKKPNKAIAEAAERARKELERMFENEGNDIESR